MANRGSDKVTNTKCVLKITRKLLTRVSEMEAKIKSMLISSLCHAANSYVENSE